MQGQAPRHPAATPLSHTVMSGICTRQSPSVQADQPSAFGHHPGSPWLLPPTARRPQELAYSIARGPTCYLHATAKPLCRVQIPDITVRLKGGVYFRPFEPLVMWHARTTSRSLLQYGATSQSAQTHGWISNSEEQLRATSSRQAPPRRGGHPRHISPHYTARIPSIVEPSHQEP